MLDAATILYLQINVHVRIKGARRRVCISNREIEPKHNVTRPVRRWFSRFIFVLAIMILSMIIFIFIEKSKSLPPVQQLATPQIVDVTGEPLPVPALADIQYPIPLRDMSPWIIKATIAIEDRRFYRHPGIDLRGLVRAFLVNIQSGSLKQGGSTITQQLARNLYLSREKTLFRKLAEAELAIRIELQKSKSEILEQYLNTIYYGHHFYGIESASRGYFGKAASELTIGEAALLAGIPKGPAIYSPDIHLDFAKKRQKEVLQAMFQNDEITKEQQSVAITDPIALASADNNPPHAIEAFANYVYQNLPPKPDTLNSNPVIMSTINLSMQKLAVSVINDVLKETDHIKTGHQPLQAALVAIDPRSGAIRAMVGGDTFNRAISSNRQPGSSFKPILYLTALKQRWVPTTRLISEPTMFIYDHGRKTYRPNNYENHYAYREIDMRRALAESDNIYAVKTIMSVGPENVVATARSLGITSALSAVPALALGTFPVSPLEMCTAYASIANGGNRVTPYSVEEISKDGNLIFKHTPALPVPTTQPETFVLTSLMQSVLDPGGTGYRVSHDIHRPVAAKTGTTKTDAWMVGFTPELAVAVWVGYDKNKPLATIDARKAAPIFARFIDGALANVPPKIFEPPMDSVVSIYIDPETGNRATSATQNARLEWFVKGTEPIQSANTTQKDKPSTLTNGPDTNNSLWKTIKRWWFSN